jgi:1,4-alpha-glucan branching enzyme
VRQYIIDNALMLLREYGVDGLRFDDTIDIRTFGPARAANNEGAELLREINFSFRNTEPKQPGKITIAEDLQSSGDVTLQTGPTGLEFNSQWMTRWLTSCVTLSLRSTIQIAILVL